MKKKTHEFWLNKIDEWKASKETQVSFCRKNALNARIFNYHVNGLKRSKQSKTMSSGEVGFYEVSQSLTEPSIKPVLIIRTSYGCTFELPL